MSSTKFMLDVNMHLEGLNPLLPHIAGALEVLEEATLNDIQKHIQTDLDKKVSVTQVNAALENGIKLGVFNSTREFKVCREFTTRELRKIKHVGDYLMSPSKRISSFPAGMSRDEKNLMEYVKRQREQRRKKIEKKGKHKKLALARDYEDSNLYKYLCQRCKKSLEKDFVKKGGRSCSATSTSASTCDEIKSRTTHKTVSSTSSNNTYLDSGSPSKNRNFEKEQKPEKSRLIVEKNPLITEPPYYDIFT